MEGSSYRMQRADLVIQGGRVVKNRRGETGAIVTKAGLTDGFYVEIDYGENWELLHSPFPEPQMDKIDIGLDWFGRDLDDDGKMRPFAPWVTVTLAVAWLVLFIVFIALAVF